MRPSFEAVSWKSHLEDISRRAFSTMLGLPSVTLITACSKPDDFVNSRTDLFFAAPAALESRSPAPAAAVVRRKSRRVENAFILFVRRDRGFDTCLPTNRNGRRRSLLRAPYAGK